MLSHKPEQLLHVTRGAYRGSGDQFGCSKYVTKGFTPQEQRIYSKYITKKGTILVVGCAGGREAIPFAKAGHEVFGIDYVPDLIEAAKRWARNLGMDITYVVRDICSYTPNEDFYDFITFTIYLFIPTRNLRIAILQRLRDSLKENGLVFLYFQNLTATQWQLRNRAIFLFLRLFNPHVQYGDCLQGMTFTHVSSEEELREEVARAGFNVLEVSCDEYGMAVLGKKPTAPAWRSPEGIRK
jgi:2-polyprenyl-3-methyl-5-hydroxy-6-metoxy-1,4-benzoquinol methylase